MTRGFHLTAMSELAAEAQVSVGQIYRLFKNKSDIILAIVEDDSVDRGAQLDALLAQVESGALMVDAAFERMTLMALSEKDEALGFEIMAEANRTPAVAETIGGICQTYRTTLRALACRANDRLTDQDLEAAVELLLACLFGLSHRNLSRPKLNIETTAAQTARLILGALRAATA